MLRKKRVSEQFLNGTSLHQHRQSVSLKIWTVIKSKHWFGSVWGAEKQLYVKQKLQV